MALHVGTRFGPYEIVGTAGAGGMGEVYRARDTRLGRTVALKVLSPDLTSHPAARQRFEREARAIAALSHSHICTLHDIGRQDGTDFLVMEYLDGETLAARLARGRLPIDQAVQYAIQIADALAAAHNVGVIHRDLKPGNIMLTKGGAKLLDFGLAKAGVPLVGLAVTQLATEEPLTAAGTLLGTLHYMAPEQLQGAPTDARTDVFAFGCVLYEMISGHRPFSGDTPASMIAAVLEHEPDPLDPSTNGIAHPTLDPIIRICLAKSPQDRWSSGHDVWLALRQLAQAGEPPALASSRPRSRRAALPWVIVALIFAGIITTLYTSFSRSLTPSATPAVQAWIDFPDASLSAPKLSPDGRYLSLRSFIGHDGRTILVCRLADGQARWLAGTEHATPLTWSGDSRSLVVLADGDIKAVDVATGGIRRIGRAPDGVDPLDGAWSGEDLLLGGTRLRRMSITDGHVREAYATESGVSAQIRPSFLPDGRTFLYSQESNNSAKRGVFLGTLDSSEVIRLLPEPASAVVSPRGYLLYGRQGMLFAQRFDLQRNRLVADPASIGSGLAFFGSATEFDISGDTLVWSTGTSLPPATLTWFDKNGRKLNEIGEVREYNQIALAPDGRHVMAGESDSRSGGSALFLIEPTRNIHARLTAGDQPESDPVWSPDSREIAFLSENRVFRRSIDQSGRATLLAAAVSGVEDWSYDARFLIVGMSAHNISALPLDGEQKPIPLIESSSMVDEPRVSRDGRWLAYGANDTGQWEVYVQPFMRPGGRVRLSISGGSQPRWRADGKELFYLTLNGAMMSVDTSDPANPGAAHKLFQPGFWVNPVEDQYEVTPDGQRFLLIVPEGKQATRLTVLANWPSAVPAR